MKKIVRKIVNKKSAPKKKVKRTLKKRKSQRVRLRIEKRKSQSKLHVKSKSRVKSRSKVPSKAPQKAPRKAPRKIKTKKVNNSINLNDEQLVKMKNTYDDDEDSKICKIINQHGEIIEIPLEYPGDDVVHQDLNPERHRNINEFDSEYFRELYREKRKLCSN